MKKRAFAILLATVFMMSFIGCQNADKGDVNEGTDTTIEENNGNETLDENVEKESLEEILDRVSYDFETFDGATAKVDKSNIIDAFEFDPRGEMDPLSLEEYSGYEIVAPGRDFVYASDGTNYLIIDYINGIYVTCACQDANQ